MGRFIKHVLNIKRHTFRLTGMEILFRSSQFKMALST